MPVGKEHSAHHWLIDVNGCLVSAKHHIGSTARTWTRNGSRSLPVERKAWGCQRWAQAPKRDSEGTQARPRRLQRPLRVDRGDTRMAGPHVLRVESRAPDAIPWVGGVILDWQGFEARGAPLVDDSCQWAMPGGDMNLLSELTAMLAPQPVPDGLSRADARQ